MLTPDSPQSRREFLARTAAASGAAALIANAASTAVAREIPRARPRPPLGPDDPVKIAIVGIGAPGMCAMGAGHIDAFCSLAKNKKANVQIAALCDLNTLTLDYGKNKVMEGGQAETPDTFTDHKKLF